MNYQKLFDYMKEQHGVTLLESDMQEIRNIVLEPEKPIPIPECYYQPDSNSTDLHCRHCGRSPFAHVRGEFDFCITLPEGEVP